MSKHQEQLPLADRAFAAVKENPYGYLVLIGIILLVSYWVFTANFGPKQPGAFLERASYDNSVYVLVFPEKDSTKNYRVPGDIYRGEDGYTISSVTWPNGGSSTFGDCVIKLDTRTECTITNSEEFDKLDIDNYDVKAILNLPSYYIQLTDDVVST